MSIFKGNCPSVVRVPIYFYAYSQAAIQAAKEGFHEVMLSHFEWAKDRIIMGSERKSAYIDDKNKLMTAYHEVCCPQSTQGQ